MSAETRLWERLGHLLPAATVAALRSDYTEQRAAEQRLARQVAERTKRQARVARLGALVSRTPFQERRLALDQRWLREND